MNFFSYSQANVCTKYSERTCEISEDQKYPINNVSSLEIIEVWNNPTQRAKIRKKLESNITNYQNKNQNKGLLYTYNKFSIFTGL